MIHVSMLSRLMSIAGRVGGGDGLFGCLRRLRDALCGRVGRGPSLGSNFSSMFLFGRLFCTCCCLGARRPRETCRRLIGTGRCRGRGGCFVCRMLCFSACTECCGCVNRCRGTSSCVSAALIVLGSGCTDSCTRRLLIGTGV